MASREASGPGARTWTWCRFFDACGYDTILNRDGGGAEEVDIARTAPRTVRIQVPRIGDEVQMLRPAS